MPLHLLLPFFIFHANPTDCHLLASMAAQVVAKLKPHTLVLNAGLWRRNRTDWPTELYDSIFEAGIKAVAPQVTTPQMHAAWKAIYTYILLHTMQGGHCVWKTTTLARGNLQVGRDRDAAAVEAAQRHGWLVTDAWGATNAAKTQLGTGIYFDPVRRLRCHEKARALGGVHACMPPLEREGQATLCTRLTEALFAAASTCAGTLHGLCVHGAQPAAAQHDLPG